MPSHLTPNRFTTVGLTALPATGSNYDVSDATVPGLLLRVGPAGTKRSLFREVQEEPIRILKKDVLAQCRTRDARTITSREITERLDEFVARGAPVMANRTAAILSQLFAFGVHRAILTMNPVSLLFMPGRK